ncbi:DUF3466 family protein [Rhodohalobacter sp. SW132]|uniref:DUF3466 family protein n=1 Tax=Rhodohalobacter sp. SW132 TaxID=2293433 RepID=UPI000E245B0F|nr:DUF3466 family protein [Rhodohalobacter sp. SW132]REL33743.1 DUF3466 family protein [Rhodohalobacter sp. SW132]
MLNMTNSTQRVWLTNYKYNLILPFILVSLIVAFSSCDTKQSLGLQESLDVIPELQLIEGGENSTVIVNPGTESYFEFNIANINPNKYIAQGPGSGWCILWNKPIDSNNTTHSGLRLFSSYGDQQWKPLNYLLNIRESLMMDDSKLTYREIQAAIWTLMDFPEFNLNSITADQLPPRMVDNGRLNFDTGKTKQIVQHVIDNYESFEYNTASTYAVVAETSTDTQTIIIEVSESVWAYGQHSFRDPHLREQLGIRGQGKGQWGWIFELDSGFSLAVTELIAGGGDDDGTMPAEDIGTTIGTLDISKSGSDMEVTYSPYNNYLLNDLHLWVGCSLEEFPWVGNTGNVAPGRFAYSYDGKPTDSHTFPVDLGDYNCPGNIFLAAHAGGLYQKIDGELPDDPEINIEIIEIDIFGETAADSDDPRGGHFVDDTFARAVNDHGEVVGNQDLRVCLSLDCSKTNLGRYYYEDTSFKWTRDEGLLNVGGMMVEEPLSQQPVSDINNHSQVAGFNGYTAVYAEYPYSYDSGSLIEFGGLLGGAIHRSDALAINDQGQVVGYAENASGQQRAFIWHKDTGMTDLGTLPGYSQSRATDINNLAQVVGWSANSTHSSSGRRYFLWDEVNGMTDLGTDPIRSINDHGEMSSHYSLNNLGQSVNRDGFLYDPVHGAIELPTLEDGSCRAYDVNENNQVVGDCEKGDFRRAVKWNVMIDINKIAVDSSY